MQGRTDIQEKHASCILATLTRKRVDQNWCGSKRFHIISM